MQSISKSLRAAIMAVESSQAYLLSVFTSMAWMFVL